MRVLLFVLCLLIPTLVTADPIQLPTTGQAPPGTATGIAQRDLNYWVTYRSDNGSTVSSSTAQAWIPTVIDPSWAPHANWITPTANGLAHLPGGRYVFSVNFDLPAGVHAITGSLYVDDRVEIWFNGKLIADLPPGVGSGYWPTTLSNFTITSGFLVGQNLLEFRVLNTNPGTPVGLAVTQLTAQTPEPATLALLGLGLAGLARKLRKRKAHAHD